MKDIDSTLIVGIFTLIVTLIIDIINRIRQIQDNEPQLSFSLRKVDSFLHLRVQNTGKTKATNIRIKIDKIYNNGKINYLNEEAIFTIPFELSSNEEVQGRISAFDDTIQSQSFPYIDIIVSYSKSHFKKNVKYERQVFYARTENSFSINNDKGIKNISDSIDNITDKQNKGNN